MARQHRTLLMPPADSSSPDAFATCLDSALAQAASVIQQTVAGAARSLQDSAAAVQDSAERNLLVEARQVLLRKQDSLTASFPAAIPIPARTRRPSWTSTRSN
jgi:hypothetical protein